MLLLELKMFTSTGQCEKVTLSLAMGYINIR